MSFFITEQKTEEYLARETRVITMPDNSTRSFTYFILTWRSLDYITEMSSITEKQLVEWAVDSSIKDKRTFEEALPNMLAYVHRELRKHLGVD